MHQEVEEEAESEHSEEPTSDPQDQGAVRAEEPARSEDGSSRQLGKDLV
jgi:hypothetical protein